MPPTKADAADVWIPGVERTERAQPWDLGLSQTADQKLISDGPSPRFVSQAPKGLVVLLAPTVCCVF